MKAYRFEPREETKWQWGFWGFYGFVYLAILVIAVIIDKPLLSWVGFIFCMLMLLIVYFDLVGYKIRRKNNDRKNKSKMH